MTRGWPACLLALALLLVAGIPSTVAAAAAAPVAVEFSQPARLEGALDSAAGQWALLVFRDAPGDAFDLSLDAGGRAYRHTAIQPETAAGVRRPPPLGAASTPQDLPDPVRGRLGLVPGSWASLLVQAERVEVRAEPLDGVLGLAPAGSNVDGHLPRDQPAGTAVRPAKHLVPEDGAVLAMRSGGAPFRVSVAATGVRVLEWHNATMACEGGGACPGSGSPWGGAPEAGARLLDYIEVEAPGGTLHALSSASMAVVGGRAVDLAVNGTARLPQAVVQDDCGGQACPDPAGATLHTSGSLLLAAVAPTEDGRMRGRLSGAFDARIDESPAPALGGAVAAAAVAAVTIPLLVKAALALFARSARPPALRHPKRRALYDLIREEPGHSFRGLQRRLGWQNGTLSNHMARLLDARLVTSRRYRNTVRFFENDGRNDATWAATVVLANPDLRRLHGWLEAHPGSTQAAVVAQGQEAWGWRRSTTQDRLRALLEGRLAEARRRGRQVLYSALPVPAPGPSRWSPSGIGAGARAGPAQSATVSPSSTGGSFLATSHTPANTSTAAGTTFHSSGAASTK